MPVTHTDSQKSENRKRCKNFNAINAFVFAFDILQAQKMFPAPFSAESTLLI